MISSVKGRTLDVALDADEAHLEDDDDGGCYKVLKLANNVTYRRLKQYGTTNLISLIS